jgi:hypothetical protein
VGCLWQRLLSKVCWVQGHFCGKRFTNHTLSFSCGFRASLSPFCYKFDTCWPYKTSSLCGDFPVAFHLLELSGFLPAASVLASGEVVGSVHRFDLGK